MQNKWPEIKIWATLTNAKLLWQGKWVKASLNQQLLFVGCSWLAVVRIYQQRSEEELSKIKNKNREWHVLYPSSLNIYSGDGPITQDFSHIFLHLLICRFDAQVTFLVFFIIHVETVVLLNDFVELTLHKNLPSLLLLLCPTRHAAPTLHIGRFLNVRLHPPEVAFVGCIRHQAWFISVNWVLHLRDISIL